MQHHLVEEDESYFVSMTDLMVGLLFIFIIMLMFFALQYREAERVNKEAEKQRTQTTQRLVNSERVRDHILDDLQSLLLEHGIVAEVIKDQGVLRLGEKVLFDKSSVDITSAGLLAVDALVHALDIVLPCYTVHTHWLPKEACPTETAIIDSLLIEGHTDVDPIISRPGSRTLIKDNLDLSAIRATNTYRELVGRGPELLDFTNTRGSPVLSVSGYGASRPATDSPTNEENKPKNRRIDLRILMTTPRSSDADRIENKIQREMERPWR
jgi:flagellar motor protein MotB